MGEATIQKTFAVIKEWAALIRISEIKVADIYKLNVLFDDGKRVIYDLTEDIKTLLGYDDLKNIAGLFENGSLDESRTCVFWNDYIDLPSDTIYEYGLECSE